MTQSLLKLILFWGTICLVACQPAAPESGQGEAAVALPTTAAQAEVTPVAEDDIPLPPTNTPQPAPVDTTNAAADELLAIDAALAEIDQQMCAEALETYEELQTLVSQGQEMDELEAAVSELLDELENCQS